MFGLISSGIFTLISSIIGRLLTMMEARNQAAIDERQALFEANKLVVSDRARAQRLPEANFARRVIAISLVFTLIWVIYVGLWYPDSTITVPVMDTHIGFWSLLFGGGGGMLKFVQVPTAVVVAPFIDIVGVVVGFYFGSGGSLKGIRG